MIWAPCLGPDFSGVQGHGGRRLGLAAHIPLSPAGFSTQQSNMSHLAEGCHIHFSFNQGSSWEVRSPGVSRMPQEFCISVLCF